MTQLFDLNARIQQLTWSLIFYEKLDIPQAYRPSYLWFWPPLTLGGSVISAGIIHDLRRVKVPGTGPLWNPCMVCVFLVGFSWIVRYFRDDFLCFSTSHSFFQYLSISLFSNSFHCPFVGGFPIISYAVGRLYFCNSFRIWVNQLLLFSSLIANCLSAISCSKTYFIS